MFRALLVALTLLSTACWGAPQRFTASIMGEMNGENLAATYKEILDAPGGEVTLRINSPGGSLITTLVFIDLVRDRMVEKHLHVTCVGTGLVASAAAILMESPVCQDRQLEPQAVMMFHEGYIRADGPIKKEDKDRLAALNFAVAALIAPRMGMSPEAYLAWVKDGEERWVSSAFALELHFVDRVAFWDHTEEKEAPPPL